MIMGSVRARIRMAQNMARDQQEEQSSEDTLEFGPPCDEYECADQVPHFGAQPATEEDGGYPECVD